MLKLGSIQLDIPIVQAALSGYSDRAMRLLAREFTAPLTFTGLILAKSCIQPSVLRKTIFVPHDDEHPVGAQLVGQDPTVMARAAGALEDLGYDLIDLNFACPVHKVLRRKRGGFLMQHPKKLIEIFREVREAVSCPVLMKLRSGFDKSAESRDKFWQICENAVDSGVDALIIHGRTVDQLYRGEPDWDILAEVKRRLPQVPLIGSGNLFTAETVLERLKSQAVDGVAIARGAVGNPWIFTEARALLEGRNKPPGPDLAEQAAVIRHHLDMVQNLYEERKAIAYFRKFAARYVRRHPERKTTLLEFMACKTRADVEAVITQFY